MKTPQLHTLRASLKNSTYPPLNTAALLEELEYVLTREQRTYPRARVSVDRKNSRIGRYLIEYVSHPGAVARLVDWAGTSEDAHRIANRYIERDRKQRVALPWAVQ